MQHPAKQNFMGGLQSGVKITFVTLGGTKKDLTDQDKNVGAKIVQFKHTPTNVKRTNRFTHVQWRVRITTQVLHRVL